MAEKKEVISKEQALDSALLQIEKQFGKGSIMKLGDKPKVDIDSIPTGSLSLDVALGIMGVPKGRVVEVYGPESSGKTTLCLSIIAQAQKTGGVAGYVDAEHTLDPDYAKKLGVDTDNLIVNQPECGEEALEVTEALVRSGALDVIVVDSVAALVPRAEINGEMGDSHMGLQARLMSQAMRKLTSVIANSKTTVIFINQIRMKIGVMFGCFHYDTLVNFVDGRSISIGKVVDEKIQGDVYCYNEKTGEIEVKPIIDWHDNGKVETNNDFIHIQTQSINGKGRFGFTCTPNHKVLTEFGWKEAKDLSYDDKLVSKYTKTINKDYEWFLNGTIIGDSYIHVRSKNTASLKLQDSENIEYINWKLDKLSPILNFTERKIKCGYRYETDYTYEFKKLKEKIKQRDPYYMLERFTDLSFALWIMDDGSLDLNDGHRRYSISIKRFKNQKYKLESISNILWHLGYMNEIDIKNGNIRFKTSETNHIAETICRYVPECMQYKLPEEYRGKYEEFELKNEEEIVPELVEIKEIRYASNRQMRNKRKFDITVKDNHNYMVGGKYNGVIVHNSPETTTGGNALKFYASVRMDIRRIETLKKGDEAYGIRARVKVIKNKVAPPFKQAEFELHYGIDGAKAGIIKEMELVDLGVKYGLVKKAGTWYSIGDERIGQGKDNAKNFLIQNPDKAIEIENKIKEIVREMNKPEDGSFEDKVQKQQEEEEVKRGRSRKKEEESK